MHLSDLSLLTPGVHPGSRVNSSNYPTSVTNNTPVEEQWRIISRHLIQTIDNLVPSKMSTTRFNQPWITRQLKRLARKKSRSYKKAKQSDDPRDWQRYKTLKKQMQFDCRITHQKYVDDMICGDMALTNSGRTSRVSDVIVLGLPHYSVMANYIVTTSAKPTSWMNNSLQFLPERTSPDVQPTKPWT